jgi:hypothetical protein
MRSAVLAALFATAVPAVAAAQMAGAPVQPSAATPASAPAAPALGGADKQICKTHVPAGTRFATKECHTRAEWDAMAAQTQQDLNGPGHPSMNGPK